MELKYSLRQKALMLVSLEEVEALIKEVYPTLPFITTSDSKDNNSSKALYSVRTVNDFFGFNHKYAVNSMISSSKRFDFEGKVFKVINKTTGKKTLTLDAKGVLVLALCSVNLKLVPLVEAFNLYLSNKESNSSTDIYSISSVDVITPLMFNN